MAKLGIPSKHYDPEANFDAKLDLAINQIKTRCPTEWEQVLGYIRSLCLVWEVDPSKTDVITSEWHKKAALTKLVRRLYGLEEINE